MILDFFKKKEQVDNKPQEGKSETYEKAAKEFAKGMIDIQDILAPGAIENDFTYVKIDDWYYRTIFVSGYPRFVGVNWLAPVIN